MQDPFTGRATCLNGGAIPGEAERQRLQDDHRRRLEAFDRLRARAAECGFGTDQDRDFVTVPEDAVELLEGDPLWAAFAEANRTWRRLVPLLDLGHFGFNLAAENPLEETDGRLRRIGGGVEAWAYESSADHSIYKFYRPAVDSKQIGSAFAFRRGDETEFVAEARPGSYRELLEKLYIVDVLAGMPTEVVAATPEGILVAKQVPGQTLPQGDDVSALLPQGLIEIPSRFLRANRDHPRLLFVEAVPYLVADLHARNFVRDVSGRLRVIDLVAAAWPPEALVRVPMIGEWIERVRLDPGAGALPASPDDEL